MRHEKYGGNLNDGSYEVLQVYQVHPIHPEVAKYINSVKEASITVDYES